MSDSHQFQALLEELQRTADNWHNGVHHAPTMHREDAAQRLYRIVEKYSRRVSDSTTGTPSGTEET